METQYSNYVFIFRAFIYNAAMKRKPNIHTLHFFSFKSQCLQFGYVSLQFIIPILLFLVTPQAVESALMGGMTQPITSAENELVVKDRETGLLVKEHIPNYIKTGYLTMLVLL